MRRLQHRRLPRRRLRRRRVDASEALSALWRLQVLLVDGDLPLQQHEVVAVQRRRRAAVLPPAGSPGQSGYLVAAPAPSTAALSADARPPAAFSKCAAAPRGGAKGSPHKRGRTARAAGAVRRGCGGREGFEPRRRSCAVWPCIFCRRRSLLNAAAAPRTLAGLGAASIAPRGRARRHFAARAFSVLPLSDGTLRRDTQVDRQLLSAHSAHSFSTRRLSAHSAKCPAPPLPAQADRAARPQDVELGWRRDDDENDALIERSGGDASPGGEKPGGRRRSTRAR